jgi:hypothetical protein
MPLRPHSAIMPTAHRSDEQKIAVGDFGEAVEVIQQDPAFAYIEAGFLDKRGSGTMEASCSTVLYPRKRAAARSLLSGGALAKPIDR